MDMGLKFAFCELLKLKINIVDSTYRDRRVGRTLWKLLRRRFDLRLYRFEDGRPAAAIYRVFVPVGAFPDGVVITLGRSEGGRPVLFCQFICNGEVVLGEIGYFGVVGIDHGILKELPR